jgi:hypothetical protein
VLARFWYAPLVLLVLTAGDEDDDSKCRRVVSTQPAGASFRVAVSSRNNAPAAFLLAMAKGNSPAAVRRGAIRVRLGRPGQSRLVKRKTLCRSPVNSILLSAPADPRGATQH